MIGLALVWGAIVAALAFFLALPTRPESEPGKRSGRLYRNGRRPDFYSRRWWARVAPRWRRQYEAARSRTFAPPPLTREQILAALKRAASGASDLHHRLRTTADLTPDQWAAVLRMGR